VAVDMDMYTDVNMDTDMHMDTDLDRNIQRFGDLILDIGKV
jgi:hypothetical protein